MHLALHVLQVGSIAFKLTTTATLQSACACPFTLKLSLHVLSLSRVDFTDFSILVLDSSNCLLAGAVLSLQVRLKIN